MDKAKLTFEKLQKRKGELHEELKRTQDLQLVAEQEVQTVKQERADAGMEFQRRSAAISACPTAVLGGKVCSDDQRNDIVALIEEHEVRIKSVFHTQLQKMQEQIFAQLSEAPLHRRPGRGQTQGTSCLQLPDL